MPRVCAADEELVGGEVLGQEDQRRPTRSVDLAGERVVTDGSDRHASAFDGQVEEHDLVEAVPVPTRVDPVAERDEVLEVPGWKPSGHVLPVGAAHLGLLRVVHERMAAGLSKHGGLRDEPLERRALRRHIGCGEHAHVGELTAPRHFAVQHRRERGHHGKHAPDVERLIAIAAHGRDGVVVVAAAPHRAATGKQREVGERLVGA